MKHPVMWFDVLGKDAGKLCQFFRAADTATKWTVRPLGIFFWGRTWTLVAWCELRRDFRNFRLDRVAASTMLDETFRG